jgi:hypothetical protein
MNFRFEVIAERRMERAVQRWKKERVTFSGGDSLDRVPHIRDTKPLGKRRPVEG